MNQALVATAEEAPREADLAFDRLYRTSRDDVYAYAASLLRDPGAAEEVTATAFERAYRKRSRFDPGRGEARAWLFGIARNAALDELRRSGRRAGEEAEAGGASAEAAPAERLSLDDPAGVGDSSSSSGAASKARNRSVERSAVMFIGTEPSEVSEAASQIYEIVHANDGVVLSSEFTESRVEDPEGTFELLIPSGRLGDALASFSAIGEVLAREESTDDITAPTVGTADRLRDSRARIDSLLGQLAEAGSEEEREAVERELRGERRRAARLRERLASLKRSANLSRVSVQIVSNGAAGVDGGWSVGDAFDDAGEALAVAAAVAILVLAGLLPLALIALLVWLARRAWLRRARARALG